MTAADEPRSFWAKIGDELLSELVSRVVGGVISLGAFVWVATAGTNVVDTAKLPEIFYSRSPQLLFTEAQLNWRVAAAQPKLAVVTLINPGGRLLEGLTVTLTPKTVAQSPLTVDANGNNDYYEVQADGAVVPEPTHTLSRGVVTVTIPKFPARSKVSVFILGSETFRLGKDGGVHALLKTQRIPAEKLNDKLYLRREADRVILIGVGLVAGLVGAAALATVYFGMGWLRRRRELRMLRAKG